MSSHSFQPETIIILNIEPLARLIDAESTSFEHSLDLFASYSNALRRARLALVEVGWIVCRESREFVWLAHPTLGTFEGAIATLEAFELPLNLASVKCVPGLEVPLPAPRLGEIVAFRRR